ncbi:hypothetical protein [Tropicibacter naphthalenivorans]|uniref:Uncharacterized protein n=1 Tax=Tropicibacter naphthalenivorans TaxID=441103 RepID=A0A0P1H3G5_9RHOB|nr:hypothetical protein [Tropicibacter naphthalenivorans]CUH82373.1 hypothetical protein TRN7648_03936 [Tropicibacter naphthalenivorans]SMD05420.1 hypothetical protein SAMN04488093_1136 [Tropicibacter naphthalenivorans]
MADGGAANNNTDFRTFVERLIIFWEPNAFQSILPSTSDTPPIQQVSFLTPQALPETDPQDPKPAFEIRSESGEFLGRALAFANGALCEVLFTFGSTAHPIPLTLVPLGTYKDQDPVQVVLDASLSAPEGRLHLIQGDPRNLPSSALTITDTPPPPQDPQPQFQYLRGTRNGAIVAGPITDWMAKPGAVAARPARNRPAAITTHSSGLSFEIKPVLRSPQKQEQHTDTGDNPRDAGSEQAWMITLLFRGEPIEASNTPHDMTEAARLIARAMLDISLTHFHLRRWLAKQESLRGVSRYSPYSQGTLDHATIHSLFQLMERVDTMMLEWVQGIDDPENHPEQAPEFLPDIAFDELSERVADYAEMYNGLTTPMRKKLQDAGITLHKFVASKILDTFTSLNVHTDAQKQRFDAFQLVIATHMIRQLLERMLHIKQVGLATDPMTPDMYDVYQLFRADTDGLPVSLVGAKVGANQRQKHPVSNDPGAWNKSAFVNLGSHYHFIEENLSAKQTLAPLFDLATARVQMALQTLEMHRAHHGHMAAAPAAAVAPPPEPQDLFVYRRRAQALARLRGSGVDALRHQPGQALRMVTDAKLPSSAGIDPSTPDFTFKDRVMLDPTHWRSSRLLKASDKARRPGPFSNAEKLDHILPRTENELGNKGGRLWAEPDSTGDGYPFAILGVEESTAQKIRTHKSYQSGDADNESNTRILNAIWRQPIPDADRDAYFDAFTAQWEPIKKYLKKSTGQHYQDILESLPRAEQTVEKADTFASRLETYLSAFHADIDMITQTTTGLILSDLFQDKIADPIPKDLNALCGTNPDLQTAWLAKTNIIAVQLLALETHIETIAERDNISEIAMAPLRDGALGEAKIDLACLSAISARLQSIKDQPPFQAKLTAAGQMDRSAEPVKTLTKVWKNALPADNPTLRKTLWMIFKDRPDFEAKYGADITPEAFWTQFGALFAQSDDAAFARELCNFLP